MYRKNVTYTDFNGNEVTDSLYFNLTEVELMEMQLRNGDMQEMLERLSKSKDMYQIVSTIKDIICSSYGEKSLDGKRFIKSREIVDAFKASEAYSVLFTELMQDENAAAEFVNGIMPASIQAAVAAENAKKAAENAALPKAVSEVK